MIQETKNKASTGKYFLIAVCIIWTLLSIRSVRAHCPSGCQEAQPLPTSTPVENKACLEVRKVERGILWKPKSDVNDNRGGKPVVLITGEAKTGQEEIVILSVKTKEPVCNFTSKASSTPGINGGAEHYYSGWFHGCNLTAQEIWKKSKRVYLQMSNGICYGGINPRQRTGGL